MTRLLHTFMLSLLLTLPLVGQEVRVIPSLEPTKILIGEQTTLQVRIAHPKDAAARLILPKDTLVTGVEIMAVALADSVEVTDQIREHVYSVTLTAFDSANYVLNNIQAMVAGELYDANEAPILVVNTVPVDLTQPDTFSDIKEQWKPDFVWKDYLWIIITVLAVLLLALGGYFLWRYLKKRKETPNVEKLLAEPLADPYEEALRSMEQLREARLWEQNQVKEYYTTMTDILRRFIWRVYGIDTAEKTSREILESFHSTVDNQSLQNDLRKILTTADIVKFAKYIPTPDDNISLMNASVSFVKEQKPEPEDKEEEQKQS